jgi:C4-type Zn-finger protein
MTIQTCKHCGANAIEVREYRLELAVPFAGQSYMFVVLCKECATKGTK